MPLVISFVGHSNSGKTTLLERVIKELKSRGYRLATIKHTRHTFDIDQAGKDSWRFAEAGSDTIFLSSPHKLALIKQLTRETDLEELINVACNDTDFVLLEGYKEGRFPKIEVHRKESGSLACSSQELLAVVTDEPLNMAVPEFSFDQTKALVDFMLENALLWPSADRLELTVNSVPVSIDEHAQLRLRDTLLDLVYSLPGIEEVESMHISLQRGRG